jgi:molecular chaperone DnaK
VLHQNRLTDDLRAVRQASTQLLVECQRLKEGLSRGESATLELPIEMSDWTIHAVYTRSLFEELLDRHELFTQINQIALNGALERGYLDDDVCAVLMVGGSSQIPAVQRTFRQMFGRERVMFHRPLDAVARGAAAFVAGVDFYDHIQHDYAIRYIDPRLGQYAYQTIVQRGTQYPTSEPVSRLAVKASHSGQTELGIAIFEMGERRPTPDPSVELVFDASGAARITQVPPHEMEQRSRFWMNEGHPTFLQADPPAQHGEARFEVEFKIDYNKRLTITARDLTTGNLTLVDHPVVRLT